MRKIAAIMLALMLCIMPAMAMKGTGYPGYDGRQPLQNAIGGQFGEDNLLLEFDSGAEYSYVKDGYIQGCFFAFDEKKEYYIELYLLMPEGIKTGDVLTPESCFAAGAASSCISMFEVDEKNGEDAWFAGQILGAAYPTNSSFSITIRQAERSAETLSVQGSISAALCGMKESKPTSEILNMQADFSFVLPLSNAPAAKATPAPKANSEITVPAFTLPPDYIVL